MACLSYRQSGQIVKRKILGNKSRIEGLGRPPRGRYHALPGPPVSPGSPSLKRLPIRRLVLPAASALLALVLHVWLPPEGAVGGLRLAAGTGVWLATAWLAKDCWGTPLM